MFKVYETLSRLQPLANVNSITPSNAAELKNVPELKRAIRDAISEIYGDAADDAEMLQQLTQTYYSLRDQVNGLAIPSKGARSVSYSNCRWVQVAPLRRSFHNVTQVRGITLQSTRTVQMMKPSLACTL